MNNPSYLFKRGSIFYFQVRIPCNIHSKHKLIRRSTKTGNRREALHIARKWWVQLMSNDFEFEAQAEVEQEMYRSGPQALDSLVHSISVLTLIKKQETRKNNN